jgi:hypothetical protein
LKTDRPLFGALFPPKKNVRQIVREARKWVGIAIV